MRNVTRTCYTVMYEFVMNITIIIINVFGVLQYTCVLFNNMSTEQNLVKALNELCSSYLNSNDQQALCKLVEDYFTNSDDPPSNT